MDAIDAYRGGLGDGTLLTFPITALDSTGIPVWNATWIGPDGHVALGFGYGATDAEAEVSALGELAEGKAAHAAIPELPRTRGSYADLAGEGAVDPVTLCLPAGASYTRRRELEWVPARRLRDGAGVLLPVEAVATEPSELGPAAPPPLFTPITNGLGAGDSFERALLHGLLELVQRDGNSVSQRALDTGVAVTGAAPPALPGIDVTVKACEQDLGIANVVAVGAERDLAGVPFPLCVTAGGEAAHPDRDAAIRKATLELAASRARKAFAFGPLEAVARVAPAAYVDWARRVDPSRDEPRALAAMRAWLALDAAELVRRVEDPVLRVLRTIPVDALPHTPDGGVAATLACVLDRLEGFDVLVADLSPPSGEYRAVKVVVPGLEVETASYGRVGARNLRRLEARDSPLVGRGAPPPGAARIHLPEGERPAWLHVERLEGIVRDLYALYREPQRHAVHA